MDGDDCDLSGYTSSIEGNGFDYEGYVSNAHDCIDDACYGGYDDVNENAYVNVCDAGYDNEYALSKNVDAYMSSNNGYASSINEYWQDDAYVSEIIKMMHMKM